MPGILTEQKFMQWRAFDGGPGVAGLHVKEDGSLDKFTTSLVRDGGGTHVSVHPSGKFLLTAQYGGGSTAFFPLNKNGELGLSLIHI